jgi:hypothetical protein
MVSVTSDCYDWLWVVMGCFCVVAGLFSVLVAWVCLAVVYLYMGNLGVTHVGVPGDEQPKKPNSGLSVRA